MFGRLGFGSKRNQKQAPPPTTGMFAQNSAASLASLPISATDHGGDAPPSSSNIYRPDVDPVTELAAWFVVGLPRPALKLVATNLMQVGRPGEFLVRDVKSDPSCYGLTVKLGDGRLLNKLIDPVWYAEDGPNGKTGTGFGIKGADCSFNTVHELIHHYSQANYPALDGIKLVVKDQFSPSIPYQKFPQPPGHGQEFGTAARNVPRPPASQAPAAISAMSDVERWALNKKLELGLATPNDVLYSRLEASAAYAEGLAYPAPTSSTIEVTAAPPTPTPLGGHTPDANFNYNANAGGGDGDDDSGFRAALISSAVNVNTDLMERVNNRREAQRLRVERMARDILTSQQMAAARADTLRGPGGGGDNNYVAPSNASLLPSGAPASRSNPSNPMLGIITALTANTTSELKQEAHQAHLDALRIEAELAEMQLEAARATVTMLRSPESQQQLLAQHRAAMVARPGSYASDSGPADIYSSVNLQGKALERADRAAAAARYAGFSPFGATPNIGSSGSAGENRSQQQQQRRPNLPARRPSAEEYGHPNGVGAVAGSPTSYDDAALGTFANAKSPLGGALRGSRDASASPFASNGGGKKRSVGFNDEHVTVSFETSKAANEIGLAAAKSEASKAHGRSPSPPPFKRGRGVRTGMSVYNNPNRVVEHLGLSSPSTPSGLSGGGGGSGSGGKSGLTAARSRALWSKVRTQLSKLTNDESRKQMLRKEEIEALNKLEVAEQSRRDKFDRQWNREVAKLDNKNSMVVQQQRAKLHQVKESESARRMKWESVWVAREHKLLYGRADASDHFNEYMADMAQREGKLDALGDTRYRKASEMIGIGKVASQTKALMGAVEAFKDGLRKPSRTEAYVMTWKREKKGSPTRPSIISAAMSDDDEDEEFGFPDEE